MTAQLNGQWNAAAFFENLTASNRLAQAEGFTFCRVSGLDGFEEAVSTMQTSNAFVCISDIADGYTELNNTPRTRRVKTVFFAMRHAAEDMSARAECMETMRELFRQFMSRLFLEKVRLEQCCIYLDPRISFNEIDRYFFSGAAGAYFQVAVDVFTDLRHNPDEWTDDYNDSPYIYQPKAYDIWLTGYDKDNKVLAVRAIKEIFGFVLADAYNLVNNAPSMVVEKIKKAEADNYINAAKNRPITLVKVRHGQKP